MKAKNCSSWSGPFPERWKSLSVIVRAALRAARRAPERFVELCLPGPRGEALRPAKVHQELQTFLHHHRRALIELPRDHGKSLQVCGRILWELGHNPSLRVRLVCSTDRLAMERSRFLREAIESSALVGLAFPELRRSRPWTATAFTIRRPAETIGPSVSAFGVGTGATGSRADLLVCDDIVDVRALSSERDRERVKEDFHNNLMNLLEPDGRFWGVFTPWHANDLNAGLKANGAYAHFRRAVGANLEPVWPEKWPRERLAERRAEIGEASFARGYRLLPVDPGGVMVRPEWVQWWTAELPRSAYEQVILAVDPAVSVKPDADRSALVVLGKLPDSNTVHCLEATAHRVRAPDLVQLIEFADRRWRPDRILFESTAAFEGIRELLVHTQSFGPRVEGVRPVTNKKLRVEMFSGSVKGGHVRLRGSSQGVEAGQRELFEELTTFPYGRHDDLVDAAVMGYEHLFAQREARAWVMEVEGDRRRDWRCPPSLSAEARRFGW